MKKIQIFIFRRDLRVVDNTGLYNASKLDLPILPIFILNPEQLVNNEYASQACINFMITSLVDLSNEIKKLIILEGDLVTELNNLIKKTKHIFKVMEITVNKDYTPYSKKRDRDLKLFCENNNIKFNKYHDILLLPKNKEKIYQKFTPFYNKYKETKITKPNKLEPKNINFVKLTGYNNRKKLAKYFKSGLRHQKGGRISGLKTLELAKRLVNYNEFRNNLNYETSRLSPHLKFGTISIREAYYSFVKINKDLIRQLFWRDFYYLNINKDKNALKNPFRVINAKYTKWKTGPEAKELFQKWCKGETGIPIIDACMRQLNNTHYMHNRGRLITADYLIKHMHINWQWGEKYFAQQLVDYDPTINNYNWQFISGSGPSASPPFRIFNPTRQSILYDSECKYIKKWIPELKDIPCNDIHNWNTKYNKYNNIYIQPII